VPHAQQRNPPGPNALVGPLGWGGVGGGGGGGGGGWLGVGGWGLWGVGVGGGCLWVCGVFALGGFWWGWVLGGGCWRARLSIIEKRAGFDGYVPFFIFPSTRRHHRPAALAISRRIDGMFSRYLKTEFPLRHSNRTSFGSASGWREFK